jgi:hypothetical protein
MNNNIKAVRKREELKLPANETKLPSLKGSQVQDHR